MRKTLSMIISVFLLVTAVPALGYRIFSVPDFLHLLNLLGYFTIQSNIAVVVLIVCSLFGKRFSRRLELMIAVAITVTAVVFQLFLRPQFEQEGIGLLVVNINHGSTAVLYLAWFFVSAPERSLDFRDIRYVLPYPAVYGVFGIIEALIREQPRYPFLDVTAQGFLISLIWVLVMAGIFGAVSLLIILFDRKTVTSSILSTRG